MCWVLANRKTNQIFDMTEFSTARRCLDYRDEHYPAFKCLLAPYHLEQRRFATVQDL